MGMPSSSKRWVSAAVAMSLMAVPAMASAASLSAPQAVSPIVALSFLASDTSRAALCGIAGANAATTAATATTTTGTTAEATTAQGAPVQGCVLPAVDVAQVAPVPVAGNGFSLIGPLAAGLAALVAVLILANIVGNNSYKPPVSPA